MKSDLEAFQDWLEAPMYGSSYNSESRLKFALTIGAKMQDLEWAFISGRQSLRQEQRKEGK